MSALPLRVGTSGFSYAAWKGTFYPERTPAKAMLREYASRLRTVEINNTFYKLPKKETFVEWASVVPEDFRFSLKASRFFTFSLKLAGAAEALANFYDVASPLGGKLGPLLVQLPPFLQRDHAALADFLAAVPKGKRVALEPHHPSWRDEAVYALMRRHDAAWVGVETDDAALDAPDTASWRYLRLRKTKYKKAEISRWRTSLLADAREVFVYFKHEDLGVGPNLALALGG